MADKDNYTRPEDKARWGFGGDAKEITVGPQTVGETGGVDSPGDVVPENDEARKNGGGAKKSK